MFSPVIPHNVVTDASTVTMTASNSRGGLSGSRALDLALKDTPSGAGTDVPLPQGVSQQGSSGSSGDPVSSVPPDSSDAEVSKSSPAPPPKVPPATPSNKVLQMPVPLMGHGGSSPDTVTPDSSFVPEGEHFSPPHPTRPNPSGSFSFPSREPRDADPEAPEDLPTLSEVHAVWSAGESLPEQSQEIIKPPWDESSYAVFSFPQVGMKGIAISDKTEATGSFAISVGCGFFHDPPSIPGVAHQLEHLVFLGAQGDEEPTAWDEFVSARGGSHNAHTTAELTTFFVAGPTDTLPELLDRFLQHLFKPLIAGEQFASEVRTTPHWCMRCLLGRSVHTYLLRWSLYACSCFKCGCGSYFLPLSRAIFFSGGGCPTVCICRPSGTVAEVSVYLCYATTPGSWCPVNV